jgi:hypothetical protein
MGRPIGKEAMTATELQRRWRAKVRAKALAEKTAAANAHVDRLIQAAVRATTEKYQAMLEESFAQQRSLIDGWKESGLRHEAHIRWFEDELARERDRHSPLVDLDDLPKRYREKIRLARERDVREFEDRVKQQDSEFEDRVKQAVRKVLDALHGEAGQNGPPVTETGYQELCEVANEETPKVTEH